MIQGWKPGWLVFGIFLVGFGCNVGDLKVVTSDAPPANKATHGGWTFVSAFGGKSPASHSGLSATSPTVTFSWNAMTPRDGTITSYSVFRSTNSGDTNIKNPIATGIAINARTYTDTSISSNTVYYYRVHPVVDGYTIRHYNSSASELKVHVPPSNMVLLHRDAANYEMCTMMGRSVDQDNHNRCVYTGPGNVSGYFDIQNSKHIDAYELGCNFTPAPACSDAVNGCKGTANPNNGVGNNGEVFYQRTTGVCYVKIAGTWTAANTGGVSSANLAAMASNQAGLPLYTTIDQTVASGTCNALGRRLLTHQEQILVSAWSSALTNAQIDTLEDGTNLPVNGRCNTNSGNGLTYDNLATPADLETISATLASGVRSVRSGSNATKNCISRYGAQDYVGNVWEWASDQLGACNAGTDVCVGATSALDTGNSLWSTFLFDGNVGPGGGGVDLTQWAFSAMSHNSTQILLPLGFPVVTGAASVWDATPIGVGTGQFDPAGFHGSFFYIITNNGGASRGTCAGGAYYEGANAGRFEIGMDITPTSYIGADVGARCARTID